MADDLNKIAALRSESPEATMAIGEALIPHLEPGDILALKGDLGAGKSTFARGMIRAALARFGIDTDDIPSPTFTLVQTYPFAKDGDRETEIWHMDCWRLETPDEILELGFQEIEGRHIALIEWPEKIAGYLPGDALTILMEEAEGPSAPAIRQVSFLAGAEHASRWREKLVAAGLM
ncbi:tRNA (adenosine(37)-N6)-threonylcarbamoyltransferase complex ATPase subunit type 1 TsaE [Alphaproteobacteria bacterium LSUCC0684]